MQRYNLKIQNSNFQIPAQIIGYVILLLFLLPFAADAATLRTPPNNLGLVGYWSMEDGSGSTATDFSGNGNDGTLTNMDPGSDWVSGRRGTALDFDGSDDDVGVGDVDVSGNNITVSAWIKTQYNGDGSNKSENQWVVAKNFSYGSSNTPYGLLISTNNTPSVFSGNVGFAFYDGSWHVPPQNDSNISDGMWHHVVGTYDGSTLKYYIDGKLNTSLSYSGTRTSNNKNTKIGAYTQDDANFEGKIDEVRIYNRALGASEVRDLYQSGYAEINRTAKVEEVGDPVGWWTFDGKDMDFSGSGTSTDRSGNGNNGSLEGGMSNADSKPGRIGQALEFDGVDDYIEVGSMQTVSPAKLTYTAWIQTTDQGKNPIYRKEESDPWHHFTIGGDGTAGSLRFTATDNNTTVNLDDSDAELDDTQWHFVAGTYDGNAMKIYIDGDQTTSTTTLSGDLSYNEDNSPTIGADKMGGTNPHFDGQIDDVRVYDQALSADEVQKLYDATRPSEMNASQDNELTDGLVGMWSFDGPSMDFGASPSTAEDVSSNSNTGTLKNGPTDAIGNIGQALAFDGSDDWLQHPSMDQIRHTKKWSFSAWFNTDVTAGSDTQSAKYIWHPRNEEDIWFGLEEDDYPGKLVLFAWDGARNYVNTGVTPEENKWYHTVVTSDGAGNYSIFVDGELEVTGSLPQPDGGYSDNRNAIGIRPDKVTAGNGWNGELDNIRIYDRELSADEVKRLYRLGQ